MAIQQFMRIYKFGFIFALLLFFNPALGMGYTFDLTLKVSSIKSEPLSAYDYFINGRKSYLLLTAKGYEDAIDLYEKAIELDENYAPAYAGLGEAFSFWAGLKEQNGSCGGFYDKSLVYSLKAVELAPNLSHTHRALATSYYALGNYYEAEREARKAIDINPNDAEAYFILWKATGKNPESEYITRALKLNPNLIMAHNDLGTAYSANGEHEKAIDHFRRAIELNPDNEVAHNNLGHALAETGEIDDAIREYKNSIEIDPNNDLTHSNLGTALLNKGDIGKAIREYKKAIEINPNSPPFHYNLGTTFLLAGRIEEGIEELKKTVEINPSFGEAYTNLGRALLELGMIEEALDAFAEAININPNDLLARKNLHYAFESNGQLERLLHFKKSIELAPHEEAKY